MTSQERFGIHGYKGITENGRADSHLVPMILQWSLRKSGTKGRRGQEFRVHTYPTTSSRSLVQIGSEMWICISSIQTNIHLYIQNVNQATLQNYFK
jgi:hypothetical protein